MKIRNCAVMPILLAGIVTFGGARAENVTLAISQETSFGQSVFVTGNHPILGTDSVTQSIKLSPHDYPSWEAAFELPPGQSITARFILRDDSPNSLGNLGNGAEIETFVITTPPDPNASGMEISLLSEADAQSFSALLESDIAGQDPVTLPMPLQSNEDGVFRYAVQIPAEHLHAKRSYTLLESDSPVPGASDIGLTGADTQWRHGQAFLYDPPTEAPLPQRRENFSFAPSPESGFQARTIRVLLPRDYDRNTEKHYPVLYTQDGQNVFSPGGAFGSWDLDISVRQLIERGEIPEIIVVAIDNSNARLTEYMPEYVSYQGNFGNGRAFLTMIRDQLIPEVNSRYRTRIGPANTAHIGSSLGGILGFMAADEFHETFGSVIAMSPSIWLAPNEFRSRVPAPGDEPIARLWIDSGTAGTSNDDYWNTIGLRDEFLSKGWALGSDLQHRIGIGDQHNEAAWRGRAPDALRWLYAPLLQDLRSSGEAWMLTTSSIESELDSADS